ncbi:MAG: hypothetical protein RMZ69_04560, partial [Nostoc sp. ChiQUE01a]|nr:hypothetical protein [Nostoc sp. ChiQUE01a]
APCPLPHAPCPMPHAPYPAARYGMADKSRRRGNDVVIDRGNGRVGHSAWGMGHGAWGMGHGKRDFHFSLSGLVLVE